MTALSTHFHKIFTAFGVSMCNYHIADGVAQRLLPPTWCLALRGMLMSAISNAFKLRALHSVTGLCWAGSLDVWRAACFFLALFDICRALWHSRPVRRHSGWNVHELCELECVRPHCCCMIAFNEGAHFKWIVLNHCETIMHTDSERTHDTCAASSEAPYPMSAT
jgi:hypothetical protein